LVCCYKCYGNIIGILVEDQTNGILMVGQWNNGTSTIMRWCDYFEWDIMGDTKA
jgi:hypothetical protein